jgi:CheY-like chemotaxis protein
MDLGMPNKDGFDASSEILQIQRKNKNLRPCNIVALTSFTDQQSN